VRVLRTGLPLQAHHLDPAPAHHGRREISRLNGKPEHKAELAKLLKAYGYHGDGTCATDGLCGTRCPVGIDTGKMTKALRAEHATQRQKKAADWVGGHFEGVARTVSAVLSTVDTVHAMAGTASWTHRPKPCTARLSDASRAGMRRCPQVRRASARRP
jgi:L-lactate utilization protein LutB